MRVSLFRILVFVVLWTVAIVVARWALDHPGDAVVFR